jgi:hypothetical protein
MYCPACGSELAGRSLLDPYIEGYICANGHIYFTTLNEQRGALPRADTVDPPPMQSDVDVLKFWLTDALARKRVPNQLAWACRRLVEVMEADHHVGKPVEPFAFCPTCGTRLAHFASDDLYMQGLRCPNGHELWWRGNTVWYDRNSANLSVELADDDLPRLIEYYTRENDYVTPYVHPTLRGLLRRVHV